MLNIQRVIQEKQGVQFFATNCKNLKIREKGILLFYELLLKYNSFISSNMTKC